MLCYGFLAGNYDTGGNFSWFPVEVNLQVMVMVIVM